MPRVSNEEFITRLTALYESSSSSGSVYLSSKRITHPEGQKDVQGDTEMTDGAGGEPRYPIIFRASNGKDNKAKKVSISTAVSPSSLLAFQSALQPAIRAQASVYLRKRDKAKERKVDKALAARRKKDEELGGWKGVAKLGSKRGAGHRQQQRARKRALKLRKEEAVARKRAAAAGGVTATTTEGGAVPAASKSGTAPNTTQQATAASSAGQQSQQQQQQASTASKKKKKKGGKK